MLPMYYKPEVPYYSIEGIYESHFKPHHERIAELTEPERKSTKSTKSTKDKDRNKSAVGNQNRNRNQNQNSISNIIHNWNKYTDEEKRQLVRGISKKVRGSIKNQS